MFLQAFMGEVKTLVRVSIAALSRYCPIPVVAEQQQKRTFRGMRVGGTESRQASYVVAHFVARANEMMQRVVWRNTDSRPDISTRHLPPTSIPDIYIDEAERTRRVGPNPAVPLSVAPERQTWWRNPAIAVTPRSDRFTVRANNGVTGV